MIALPDARRVPGAAEALRRRAHARRQQGLSPADPSIHLRGAGTDLVVDVDDGRARRRPLGRAARRRHRRDARRWLRSRAPSTARSCRARPTSSPRSRSCPSTARGSRAGPGCAATGRGGRAWSPRFQPSAVTSPAAAGSSSTRSIASPGCGSPRRSSSATRWWCGLGASRTTATTATCSTGWASRSRCPTHASELLTFHGRARREFQPHRRPWPSGARARRELARSHVARAPAAAVRRHARVRRVAGRGLGRPPGVERQPRDRSPSGCPTAGGSSSSASCFTPARWRSSRASRTRRPRSSPSTPPTD